MSSPKKMTADCVVQSRGKSSSRTRTGLRAGSLLTSASRGLATADVVSEKVGPDHVAG